RRELGPRGTTTARRTSRGSRYFGGGGRHRTVVGRGTREVARHDPSNNHGGAMGGEGRCPWWRWGPRAGRLAWVGIVEDVAGAAEWMARALRSSGYHADFSGSSLWEVERFFDDHAPNGQATPNGLLSEKL